MVHKNSRTFASILRYTAIVLMSLTAAFTVLSGVGTSCVALAAEQFGPMSVLAPYKYLYTIFVVTTLAVGILGIRSSIMLIKGHKHGYRSSLLALILGILVGVMHVIASRRLRGASMPVDAVLLTTVVTLIIFTLLRIPGVRDLVNSEETDKKRRDMAGGLSAIVVSGFMLSIQFWMAPTHTIQGVNYADDLQTILLILGSGLGLSGVYLIGKAVLSPTLSLKDISASENNRPDILRS